MFFVIFQFISFIQNIKICVILPLYWKNRYLEKFCVGTPLIKLWFLLDFFYCFKNSVCLLPKQLVYFFILIVCSEYPKLYNYFSHNFNKNFRNFEILLSILVTLVIIFTLKWTIIGNYFFLFSNYFPMILKISMSWFFPHDFL